MPLALGTRFGPYEVTAYLGAGGMGEVYRARDTVLGRDVALKVLPAESAWEADGVARLEREARLLAALNHHNIATIHGFEQSAPEAGRTARALVLELVEGPTLDDRLARGPMRPDETLIVARQIIDALEAAHGAGIIHRDLKPSNIKLRADGTVKVLDFGIAKALESADSAGRGSQTTMTRSGAVLGTAAYMSPEQARGQSVDERTDIWAFGCVLFELLTGRSPFAGTTQTDALAAVLEREPDWTKLPAATPPSVRRLLHRCLQKDLKRRLADVRDARLDLDEEQEAHGATPARVRTRMRSVAAVALVASAAALATAGALRSLRPASDPAESRLEINTPSADPWSFALAPDGRKLAYVAIGETQPRLWLRPFEADAARPLPGTDGAAFPFWSPDSRAIGFFADGQLKRIEIDGGSVQSLATAVSGSGGTWNDAGEILFSPNRNAQLLSVAATGGAATPATHLDAPRELGHLSPSFLPNGRHFLYYVQTIPSARGIYLGLLGSTVPRRLLDADAPGVYAAGHLLFIRQGTLFAQPFDASELELTGDPFPVAQSVLADVGNSSAALSASATGSFAYRLGLATGQSQLVWLDRNGRRLTVLGGTEGIVRSPAISPDGSRVAFYQAAAGNTDVWVLDVEREVPTRFTFDAAFDNSPVWSTNGAAIAFASNRTGTLDLYRKPSAGNGEEELLLQSDLNKIPTDWSADGRFLLYRTTTAQGFDVLALPLTGERTPIHVAATTFDERDAQFSPDGKWVAYQSNESGRFEIYVQPFPEGGAKSLISIGGGAQVRWRRDGREIFYVSLDNRLMSVPIELAANQTARAGTPVPLFPLDLFGGAVPVVETAQYVVAEDGQRFLVNASAARNTPITVVSNWRPGR